MTYDTNSRTAENDELRLIDEYMDTSMEIRRLQGHQKELREQVSMIVAREDEPIRIGRRMLTLKTIRQYDPRRKHETFEVIIGDQVVTASQAQLEAAVKELDKLTKRPQWEIESRFSLTPSFVEGF